MPTSNLRGDPAACTAPAVVGSAGCATLPLLERHPVPMLLVDAGGTLAWMNAASRAAFAPAGGATTLPALLGIDAIEFDSAIARDLPLPAGAGAVAWYRVAASPPSEGLRLLTLTPVDDLQREVARASRLSELLDMAQEFGRLGVWERDLRTLQGTWDRHVYRIWGIDPSLPTPDFGVALGALVAEDREGIDRAFRASLSATGAYSHRYRVRRPDGSVRQLHSQWVVKNGADGLPQRALGIMMDDTDTLEFARSHDTALAQLTAAVELARIGIWRHDLRTDRIEYNGVAHAVLDIDAVPGGAPIDEVRKRIHPDDLPVVVASAQQALATDEPADYEARYRRRDGVWRTLLTRRRVQRDANGAAIAFIGVGLDVTEQREQARQAQEMMRRFELATRATGIGYWSLEHGAERAHWSEQTRAMVGLSPGDAVPAFAEWLDRIVHPYDRERVGQSYADWLHSGRTAWEIDYRIVRTDGEVLDLITHSRMEGPASAPLQFGIVVDVTERRAAELALRRAAERATLVAQGVGIGTWEYDLRSPAAYWDEQMWRLRGLEPQPEPLTAEERLRIVHPDDRDAVRRVFSRTVADPAPVDYEFRVCWPDGSWHWLASRSTTVLDGDGAPLRRIGVNWDITDARSAVVAREEKAAAQREVQAKSRFLSRMSHELRTPLNAVLGFAQLLLIENDRSEAASRQRRLEHIRSAGQHLLSLIDDVLDLSRLEGGEVTIALAHTALRPVVEQALALVEPLAREHSVRIFTGTLDAVPLADPTRLRQVLLNLLTNAIKYNRPGGSVSIDAEQHAGVVELRVTDTGRGMSPEQQQHLFEPFNRLGAERSGVEGTGIGLAIVKALVERMGGTVEVTSAAGAGSRFVVRLRDGAHAPPPAPQLAGPQALALAAAPGRVATGGKVLYIEDNPVNAMIVSELLARRGDLALQTAVDGRSGVDMARSGRPDLILLDMQLPDFDGHEVFAQLQADPATAAIPCIALSANAMPADIDRALRCGFADYWTKPLDFRTFTASIDALFGPAPG